MSVKKKVATKPKRRKIMGRPTKNTHETRERILKALRAGNTRRAAAAMGGISPETLYEWINNFSDFSDAVKKAESLAEAAHVRNIRKASTTGSWQASAWWLERRKAQEWKAQQDVKITGQLSHEHKHRHTFTIEELESKSPDELNELYISEIGEVATTQRRW